MEILRHQIMGDKLFIYTEVIKPYRNIVNLFYSPTKIEQVKLEAVNYLVENQIDYRIKEFLNFEDLFAQGKGKEFRFTFEVYQLNEIEYFISSLEMSK